MVSDVNKPLWGKITHIIQYHYDIIIHISLKNIIILVHLLIGAQKLLLSGTSG